MQTRRVLACGVLVLGLLSPLSAFAEQRNDWLLAAPGEPGTYVNLDVIFGAFQAGIEHRVNIFGGANQLTLRGSAIAAVPFSGTQIDADLRMLILTLGMSVGGMDVWRNQTFVPGEPVNRKERRERDAAGDYDSSVFGFWEGRAGIDLPFNDYVLLHNVNSYRASGAPMRSFDNLLNVVHDGNYGRCDFQLFFKHRDYGGIGPMFQVLDFSLDGHHHTQLNYGFVVISRAGLARRDDLLLFQMLWNVGDTLGGYNNSDAYGMAMLRGPVMFTFAYRSVISL